MKDPSSVSDGSLYTPPPLPPKKSADTLLISDRKYKCHKNRKGLTGRGKPLATETVFSVQCSAYSVQRTVYSVQCSASISGGLFFHPERKLWLFQVPECVSVCVPADTLWPQGPKKNCSLMLSRAFSHNAGSLLSRQPLISCLY